MDEHNTKGSFKINADGEDIVLEKDDVLIALRCLPYFGPSVFNCVLNEYEVNALTSSVYSTSLILRVHLQSMLMVKISFLKRMMFLLR